MNAARADFMHAPHTGHKSLGMNMSDASRKRMSFLVLNRTKDELVKEVIFAEACQRIALM